MILSHDPVSSCCLWPQQGLHFCSFLKLGILQAVAVFIQKNDTVMTERIFLHMHYQTKQPCLILVSVFKDGSLVILFKLMPISIFKVVAWECIGYVYAAPRRGWTRCQGKKPRPLHTTDAGPGLQKCHLVRGIPCCFCFLGRDFGSQEKGVGVINSGES